ncbi:MAG: branched-chain amino acid ABC transporter permease [Thermomicrobiales bacterium]
MGDFFRAHSSLIVSMVFAAMLGLSLYIPLMAGQLSLASPGFYALGGYVAAVFSTKVFKVASGAHFPILYLLVEMAIAAILCAALAIVVGIPALRLRGIYLALATVAFVEILRVVALNLKITGGAVGIFKIPQPFGATLEYLWIAVPLLILAMAFVYRLEKSRIGRAFTALREDELAADAMGIPPTYHKVLAFTMGGMLAGIVGAVSAHFLNTWNTRQGDFNASITVLAIVLVGGSRTFLGPVLGGLFLTALPEILRSAADISGLPHWLSQFLKDGRLIIFGLLLVLCTIFFPQGIITPEFLARVRRLVVRRPAKQSADEVRAAP